MCIPDILLSWVKSNPQSNITSRKSTHGRRNVNEAERRVLSVFIQPKIFDHSMGTEIKTVHES